jgi:hypothetical protein
MSGYIGSKASVTLVDGYNRTEADAEFVQDPNGAITVSGSNVGIGTSSPSANLDVASSNATIHLTDTDDTTYAEIRNNGGTLTIASDQGDAATNSSINFKVDASEAMRIDGSGNLLVGTTSITAPIVNNAGAGITLRGSNGQIYAGGADTQPLTLNRETSDGDIVQFRKDGSTVGSIGSRTASSNLFINTGSSGRLATGGVEVFGWNNSRRFFPAQDNNSDLGVTNLRWDDIYATNGSIQTSDANEKQDVAALTATEMLVAARISAMFKTFRWIDSVTAKGDNARTHTGVIAQDVQAAFTAEGLEAGDYALFTSNTWWETQTDVPAVEADEDNDIEAADAYTRTDTYDTLAEAPDGATERTRMGIRYPELLAFVGAYSEQRFASIETRLAALEGN